MNPATTLAEATGCLRDYDPQPIRWERLQGVLRPDELTRARLAAEAAGIQ